MNISMDSLLMLMFEKRASDLHMIPGAAPAMRVEGNLMRLDTDILNKQRCRELIYSVLTDKQKEQFEAESELDLSFAVQDLGRVRMNVYIHRSCVCAAFRSIPNEMKTFQDLGLPAAINDIVTFYAGLVLVTGPTGSGKSTTLASVIDYLNQHRKSHIITIEDPIEYVHNHKNCLVSQREVGSDTASFPNALKFAMRQDPDIILIGEMRDLETIGAALTIAETGHLVFATLHTPDAPQSINRIIDVFPPYQQNQVKSQLSMVLMAVLSQKLVTRSKHKGGGIIVAVEVLMVTAGVRNMIRDGKIEQIRSAMQSGGETHMQTMNMALCRLYKGGEITYDQALEYSLDRKDMLSVLGNKS
ncbi:MAG: PilT/PilU family type 4a pilus ATPase [Elusimicrobiota bacterium]